MVILLFYTMEMNKDGCCQASNIKKIQKWSRTLFMIAYGKEEVKLMSFKFAEYLKILFLAKMLRNHCKTVIELYWVFIYRF